MKKTQKITMILSNFKILLYYCKSKLLKIGKVQRIKRAFYNYKQSKNKNKINTLTLIIYQAFTNQVLSN